jgi:hypothetical protein
MRSCSFRCWAASNAENYLKFWQTFQLSSSWCIRTFTFRSTCHAILINLDLLLLIIFIEMYKLRIINYKLLRNFLHPPAATSLFDTNFLQRFFLEHPRSLLCHEGLIPCLMLTVSLSFVNSCHLFLPLNDLLIMPHFCRKISFTSGSNFSELSSC